MSRCECLRLRTLVSALAVVCGLLFPPGCGVVARHAGLSEIHDLDSAANAFLVVLRTRLQNRNSIPHDDRSLYLLMRTARFPVCFHGLVLVLYQPGCRRIVVVRRGSPEPELLAEVVNRMLAHPRIGEFDLSDASRCRIQIDFILDPLRAVRFSALRESGLGSRRFESGVDGLRISGQGKVRYFLPGDAFVRSVLGLGQLRGHVRRMFPGTGFTHLRFMRFRTRSYVSFGNSWLRLYRGYPVLGEVGPDSITRAAQNAVGLVTRTAGPDGRFRYYYDAARDSMRDHEHPRRDPAKNPYYNLLRHMGGGLLVAEAYAASRDRRGLLCLRRAVKFMVAQIKRYELPGGDEAAYVFANRKAKLGASGLGLHLLIRYELLTRDESYRGLINGLKNHLLSQVRDTGEFRYYYINPYVPPGDRRNFSFYYPGEALMGLASYMRFKATPAERARMGKLVHKALVFLLNERPRIYRQWFKSLPSDAWLMMAICSLWEMPAMRKPAYRDFVFRDADTMVAHMYRPDHTPWPDAIGSFYYRYGDHPYPDGARCEGLLAAYELACRVGDRKRQARYYDALRAACWATLHLVNTTRSAYAVKRPDLTIGGIRFKFTRQWFRIDTIAHVAGFYLRFAPHWKAEDSFHPYE